MALPAMVGGVWVQAHRAAHAELPEYDDLDVTGYYGPDPVGGARRLRVAAVGDSTLTGPGLGHARETFVARVAAGAGVPLNLGCTAGIFSVPILGLSTLMILPRASYCG